LAEFHRELVVAIEYIALRRDAVFDVAANALGRVERRLLRKQARPKSLGDPCVADKLAVDPGHDAKEGALPRPVRAEHADLRVGIEREGDPAQDLPLRGGHDLLELIHRVDELRGHRKTVAGTLLRRG